MRWPKDHNDERSHSITGSASFGHAIRTSEQAHIYISRGDMAVDYACDDDCGDRNSICKFSEERRCGVQTWRCVVGTCVAVCYDCHNQTHRYVNALEQVQCFGVGFWGFDFGYDGEECDMSWTFVSVGALTWYAE